VDDRVLQRLLRRPPLGLRRLYLRLKLRLRLHRRRLLRRLRRLLRRLLLLRLLLRLLLPLLRPRLKVLTAVAVAARQQAIAARVRTSRALMIAEIRAVMAAEMMMVPRYLRPVMALDSPVVAPVDLVAPVVAPVDLVVPLVDLVDLAVPVVPAAVAAETTVADHAEMYREDGPLVALVALVALAGQRLLRLWTPEILTLAESIVDKPVQKEIFGLYALAAFLKMAGRKQPLLLN
jgi:hypothetical protein